MPVGVCPNDGRPYQRGVGCACGYARPRRRSRSSSPMPPGWTSARRRCLIAAGADERGIGGRCAICGRPGIPGNPLEGDHRIPRALGGTNAPDNLRAIHASHNRAEGARLKEQLRKRRKGVV